MIENFTTKIFADGADFETMVEMSNKSIVKGLTTNPSLMRKAGIRNYKAFAKDVLSSITRKPISFEVFSDDFVEMKNQALEIASWGDNVNVKIPIMNSMGRSSLDIIRDLSVQGVKLNVTAIMTLNQISGVIDAIDESATAYISVFAGRIADTGIDPVPVIKEALNRIQNRESLELIWASPRELLNIVQANHLGCDVITVTSDLLAKLSILGKDLNDYSLETVRMFYNDAKESGFSI